VGGAVLTTPGIRALGATPIESVGSTIPAILPGALSGAYRYAREGMVDWRVAISSGLFGSPFPVVGPQTSDTVTAHYLMLLTAALLRWTGIKNVFEYRASMAPVPVPVGGPADAEPEWPLRERTAPASVPVPASSSVAYSYPGVVSASLIGAG